LTGVFRIRLPTADPFNGERLYLLLLGPKRTGEKKTSGVANDFAAGNDFPRKTKPKKGGHKRKQVAKLSGRMVLYVEAPGIPGRGHMFECIGNNLEKLGERKLSQKKKNNGQERKKI